MANFHTHLTVAAMGSGMLATMCLGANIVVPKEVIILTLIGTLGGILPDIDLNHSSPTKLLFTAFAMVAAFLVIFQHAATYSILELWLIGAFAFGLVRYGAWWVFASLTVHRGIFHSVAAALFFWFLTTIVTYYLFDRSQLDSWTLGAFMCFGYLVHLLLDEVYSVDFMNNRLKRSFGTAIKLLDFRNFTTSALMVGAVVLLYWMTPSMATFVDTFANQQTYLTILDRFLPKAMWFAM